MQEDSDQGVAEARFFFERAEQAAQTNDLDSAIDLYLEGLRRAPDAVPEGHIKLRELALLRHERGGPKPSAEEVQEYLHGKAPSERMLNAEYLLAKDPGHLPYAEIMLKAAVAGGYKKTAKWMADLVFLANNSAKRPSVQLYLLLKDSYAAIGQLDRAIAACQCALRLEGEDQALANELEKLSTKRNAVEGEVVKEDLFSDEDYSAVQEPLRQNRPTPPQEDVEQALTKAWVFFTRAQKAAETNNFDYAIEMYLEGLRYAPDAVQDGHIRLHEVALLRQRRSGKKPSMMERVKHLRGKTPLEQMLNAEYLFARDPGHLSYGEAMLKAALAGGYEDTAKWVADLIFQANNAARKPSAHTYILLKNSYSALGLFERAIAACRCAARLRPDDGALADELRNLSAELTVARGHYDQGGDFRKSIKDRERQEKLQAQASLIKTEDYRLSAVEEARKEFEQDPNLPENIFGLAEVLSDLENDEGENEAIELLENSYRTKNDFSYKQRAGRIRVKQIKRKIREAKKVLQAKPDDAAAKVRLSELSDQLNNTELEHYRVCVENYPTDLQAKYEYAVRLLRSKQYDKAIPLFQEAKKDPRCRITAMDKIGLCFFHKGWFADAIDVLTQAVESYELKDDAVAKELRYNLARSYEEQGEGENALELYRKIAQLDFGYKDVSQRVDKLRKKPG